jgi:hypothetical protein
VPRDLQNFVARSLQILEREAPHSWEKLCATLKGRSVRIRSDKEEFSLRFDQYGAAFAQPSAEEDVILESSRMTILALAGGRLTLEEGLREGRLDLLGKVEPVVAFYDALLIYVGGAVRCPHFPQLLVEFRTSTVPGMEPEVSDEAKRA